MSNNVDLENIVGEGGPLRAGERDGGEGAAGEAEPCPARPLNQRHLVRTAGLVGRHSPAGLYPKQGLLEGAHTKRPALETSYSQNVPSLNVPQLKHPTLKTSYR
jgi:hypothetical protein